MEEYNSLDHAGFDLESRLGALGSDLDQAGAVFVDDVETLPPELLLVKLSKRVEDIAEGFWKSGDLAFLRGCRVT